MSSEADQELLVIEDGLYTLRASPVAGVGGVYATGNGTFKVVTVAAKVPKNFGRQTWKITAVKGKKNIYTIVLHHKHDISLGGSWSLEDNLAIPRGPIITTPADIEWEIFPANKGIHDTFFIKPVAKFNGRVTWFVGTNDKKEVAIKTSPVLLPPFPDRPYWQIIKSS
ncbi:hypothetical protein K443DRAFT_618242 [Laccaria amethystina LaAM-08-1]|uniref:Uncharacterized protein n=1 Tax=Laccaria amethystina LaAM-08-1 TaxID=1095629 RepID=A0A0C9X4Z0_9AGAR|nr:hypothetical protein K443DRAFT_618242 [Laccaria amethystina LaAM-08-1]